MIKKFLSLSICTLILLLAIASPISAQNYSFFVPEVEVWVSLEANGTMTIEYFYLFQNNLGASPIDFVDVGMPGASSYNLSDIYAEVDGTELTGINRSEYVDGIELALGSDAIQPGDSGTVYMRAENVRDVFYQAPSVEDRAYASVNFQPNYFSSDLSSGSTLFTFSFILPPGAKDGEVNWDNPKGWPGDDIPAAGFDEQGRLVYQWSTSNASPSGKYTFITTFPADLLPTDAIREERTVTFNPSAIAGVLIPVLCCGGVFGIVILVIVMAVKSAKKRRLKYLPPKIAIEGHGIKRGLTAVEAAILMEEPMDKILTMILFAVLRKDAAEVVKQDPLEIKVSDSLPDDLRTYEKQFLEAFQGKGGSTRRKALQDMMVALVKSISEKMKGFSRKETIQYYKTIMEKAWEQVENAETPEVRAEKYSDAVDWTMLDEDYDQRNRRVFGPGPVYMPPWWWRTSPTINRPAGTVSSRGKSSSIPKGGQSRTVTLPRLPGSDAAASVVNTVSAFSAGVVGNMASFTSGVTSKTNPVPKTTSSTFRSSGGSRGGGSFSSGCACACACAGCACACAGGGR